MKFKKLLILAGSLTVAAAAVISMTVVNAYSKVRVAGFSNVIVDNCEYQPYTMTRSVQNTDEVYAALNVSLNKKTVQRGDTVTAVISLNRNPGIIGIKFHMEFNEDILEVLSEPDLRNPQLYAHHVTDNGLIRGFTPVDNRYPLKSGFVLRWSEGAVLVNNTDTGPLAAVQFRVKEDAPLGEYENVIGLNFSFKSNDAITYLGAGKDQFGYPEIITLGAGAAYVEYGSVDLSVSGTTTPTGTTAPSETTTPTETTAPTETTTPSETTTPAETVTPSETTAPSETAAPSETTVTAPSAEDNNTGKPSSGTVLTDQASGISVSGSFPDGTILNVSFDSGSQTNTTIVCDITLTDRNGKLIQPGGIATVKIPVPLGWRGMELYVYRMEAEGSYTDMQAVYENGCLVFATSHFSRYIITTGRIDSEAADTDSTFDENYNVNTANSPSIDIIAAAALAAGAAAVFKPKKRR